VAAILCQRGADLGWEEAVERTVRVTGHGVEDFGVAEGILAAVAIGGVVGLDL
jgi:hypothetical protein